MAIWLCFIAKYLLAIWQHPIVKCTLAIWWQPIAKHSLAILVTSYHLNRNDRVSSFYKTRGSKLSFLTCFSYFSRYFFILVFLQICYSLISLCLSWLHRNPISRPISRTFGTPSWYIVHAPPYFWHRMHGFLEARCFPPFAKGFWCERPLGERKWYLSYSQKSSNWDFLAWQKAPLSYAVQLGYGIPKGFPNSWIRLIVGFLALCSKR